MKKIILCAIIFFEGKVIGLTDGKNDVYVLYAPIKEHSIDVPLYPQDRDSEVRACKNAKVRLEKYLVWRLLERAVREYLDLDFTDTVFYKTECGKWVCPDFHFSLSHTDGALAVAVSMSPVGVDIEGIKKINPELKSKILTERENDCYGLLPEELKNGFLLESWVKKESIFKMNGGEALMPKCIETSEYRVRVEQVKMSHGCCLLAVSTEKTTNEIHYIYTEEI